MLNSNELFDLKIYNPFPSINFPLSIFCRLFWLLSTKSSLQRMTSTNMWRIIVSFLFLPVFFFSSKNMLACPCSSNNINVLFSLPQVPWCTWMKPLYSTMFVWDTAKTRFMWVLTWWREAYQSWFFCTSSPVFSVCLRKFEMIMDLMSHHLYVRYNQLFLLKINITEGFRSTEVSLKVQRHFILLHDTFALCGCPSECT